VGKVKYFVGIGGPHKILHMAHGLWVGQHWVRVSVSLRIRATVIVKIRVRFRA